MNITSAQYVDRDSNGTNDYISAVIDGITMFVPIDTSNRHYVEIKAKHDDADDSFTIADAD
jgi:hypothetical protein